MGEFFIYVVLIPGAIILAIVLFTKFLRSRRQEARDVENSVSSQSFEERLLKKGFETAQRISCDATVMYVDSKHRKWTIKDGYSGNTYGMRIYDYNDIISFEVNQEGYSVGKSKGGGIGLRVAGPLSVGLGGGKSVSIGMITLIQVRIRLNDLSNPELVLTIFRGRVAQTDSRYRPILEKAKKIEAALAFIQNQQGAGYESIPLEPGEKKSLSEKGEKMALPPADEGKYIQIVNYSPGSMIRPVKASIDKENRSISLCLACYKDTVPRALRAEAECISIFGDVVNTGTLSFLSIDKREDLWYTENVPIKMDDNQIKETSQIKVKIIQAVGGNGAISLSSENVDAKLDSKGLYELRSKLGPDAVTEPLESDNEWRCCCGVLNENTTDTCEMCGRKSPAKLRAQEKEKLNELGTGEPVTSWRIVFNSIQEMKSCKEILELLEKNKARLEGLEGYARLMENLRRFETMERAFNCSYINTGITEIRSLLDAETENTVAYDKSSPESAVNAGGEYTDNGAYSAVENSALKTPSDDGATYVYEKAANSAQADKTATPAPPTSDTENAFLGSEYLDRTSTADSTQNTQEVMRNMEQVQNGNVESDPEKAKPEVIFCSKCGIKIPADSQFCYSCGSRIMHDVGY